MPEAKRSDRLAIVLSLMSREEEAERKAMGELQAKIRQCETKVVELIDYQRQYQNELRQSGKKGTSLHNIQNYQVFISRLGSAVEQQQQQIQLMQAQLDQQTKKWQQIYQKKNNMLSFIEQCRQEEAYAADKRQQRELDDAVCRRAFYTPKED